MSSINFDNIWLLLIALPLIAAFTVPFAIAIRKENANWHNVTSQVIHCVLAIAVAFAAAGTKVTTVLTATDVLVVADVSYSSARNLDAIDRCIRELDLPPNARLGVVAFGKDAELIYDFGSPENVVSVKNNHVDDSETNIAEALEYAGTLMSDDVIKRMVLITDGRQTDRTDDYALRRAVDGLEMRNVRVDAIFMDSTVTEGVTEVQVSDVDYTSCAFLRREERADVTVRSGCATQAIVTLYRDGRQVLARAVDLDAGVNEVSLDLDTSESGTYDYEVTVTAEGDLNPRNNSYAFTQRVSDEVKVLLITGSWSTLTQLVDRYGEYAKVDAYENDTSVAISTKQAYINSKRAAEPDPTVPRINIKNNSVDVPFMAEQLSKYDEIVLADVDIMQLNNPTELIRNLDDVVSLFGKSLVTIGDISVQSRPNDELKQLADMLPVKYGNNSEDPRMYTILVDISHSMKKLYHLRVARQVAEKLVGMLNDNDEICVLAFSGNVNIICPPRPLTNRDAIIESLNEIETRQGTLIGPGLEAAYGFIEANPGYKEKQLMVISDGKDNDGDPIDCVKLAGEKYDKGIITSVVDVGRQGDLAGGGSVGENAGAHSTAQKRLQNIAAAGGGSYFYLQNTENLTDVQFGEIADMETESVITDRVTTVNINRTTDAVLGGLNVTTLPSVNGYVCSTAKTSATTVLTVNHKRRVSETTTPIPLYAYWDYGAGRVSSFTSSLSGSWMPEWSADLNGKFFDNVFEENIPAEKNDSPYAVDVRLDGTVARVELTPATLRFNTSAFIEVTSPDGTSDMRRMTFDSYYYYYEFDASDLGKYTINVSYNYNDAVYSSSETLNISYPDEYDSFAAFDGSSLHKALDGRGEISDGGSLTIRNDDSEAGTYTLEFTIPILIVCAALYVIDIIIRKLKWEDVTGFFRSIFGRRAKK